MLKNSAAHTESAVIYLASTLVWTGYHVSLYIIFQRFNLLISSGKDRQHLCKKNQNHIHEGFWWVVSTR